MELLTYLFKAYAVCKDEEFVKYICDLQTKHEMGGRKQRLTSEVLMHQAEKKYKIVVTTKTWEAPTPGPNEAEAQGQEVCSQGEETSIRCEERLDQKGQESQIREEQGTTGLDRQAT